MEEKKTEVRIKLSTKEKHFHSDKSNLIDYVVEKIKELEKNILEKLLEFAQNQTW